MMHSSTLQKEIRRAAGIDAYLRRTNIPVTGNAASMQAHQPDGILSIDPLVRSKPYYDLEVQETVADLYRDLAKKDKGFLIQLAGSLTDLAAAHGIDNKWDSALNLGLEAQEVLRYVPSEHPDRFSALALLSNNLGIIYQRLGKRNQSNNCFVDAQIYYQRLAASDPLYTRNLIRARQNALNYNQLINKDSLAKTNPGKCGR